MRLIIPFYMFFCAWTCSAWAQETQTSYDYALLKREFIGKNEIFSVTYKNEAGKVLRVSGYIRPAADDKRIAVYSYNTVNRNYDILDISISGIQSIVRSETQKITVTDRKPIITAGGILKAAGITLVIAALALLIFHEKL